MTQKLTLIATLLIMVSVVFSASEEGAKGSPSSGRLVVTKLNLDKVVSDPSDPDPRNRRTIADIVGDLSLKQAFPPARFSVATSKGEQLIIVKSEERFRIDKSSPLYEKVERAAQKVEVEKAEQYARDNPGSPPHKPREVTPEDRHAIICSLFGISINMTNEQILNRIAKAAKKEPKDVRYEALGMVPKERPDDHSLSGVDDQ
jgi:hypothetical protein